jgi:hypothetical protein
LSGARPAKRAHRGIIAAGVLLAASGLALLLIDGGIIATVLGASLLGLAGVVFTALAFLLVGESEDRDRLRHPRG